MCMHLIEYVAQNSKYSFSQKPFNEVDALVFAQISYYDYSLFEDGISFEQITNHKNVIKATSLFNLIGDNDEKLFNLVIGSKRYKNTIVKFHEHITDKEKVTQFSATTFILSKKKAVIAYRGTDGTVIGWNEDMNMTYMFPIPGQVLAQRYINKVLEKINIDDIIVVGHSKGGNLAIYASVMVKKKLQKKITATYNFDGPGFIEAFYSLDAYNAIAPRLHKYIPEQSSVGRMMKENQKCVVIKSDASYAMQHWTHNWLIDGNHLAKSEGTDFFSESVEISTRAVLENMTIEERKDAVDTMFEILYSTGKKYMDEITKDKNNMLYCVKEYFALKDDRENVKKLMFELLKPMLKMYSMKGKDNIETFFENLKNDIKEKIEEALKDIRR